METNETIIDDKTGEATSTTPDDKGAASSTATEQDANQPKSIADVVKATAERHSESSAEEKEKPDQDLNRSAEEEEAEKAKAPDAEKEKVGDKEEPVDQVKEEETDKRTEKQKAEDARLDKHPRFQEVIKANQDLKIQAEFGTSVQNFVRSKGISDETFQTTLRVADLLTNDPAKALAEIRGVVKLLEDRVGEGALPDDLKTAVAEGEISEARAKEMSKLRAENAGREQRVQATAVQQHQQAMTKAVVDWESATKAKVPEYDRIAKLVNAAFVQRIAFNPPKTPQEVIKAAEESLAEVRGTVQTFIPKPPARKQLRSNGSSANVETAPKNLSEVVHRAAARHRSD